MISCSNIKKCSEAPCVCSSHESQALSSTGATAFTLNFGPDNAYCLSVPILTDNENQAMIQQLSAALSSFQQSVKTED